MPVPTIHGRLFPRFTLVASRLNLPAVSEARPRPPPPAPPSPPPPRCCIRSSSMRVSSPGPYPAGDCPVDPDRLLRCASVLLQHSIAGPLDPDRRDRGPAVGAPILQAATPSPVPAAVSARTASPLSPAEPACPPPPTPPLHLPHPHPHTHTPRSPRRSGWLAPQCTQCPQPPPFSLPPPRPTTRRRRKRARANTRECARGRAVLAGGSGRAGRAADAGLQVESCGRNVVKYSRTGRRRCRRRSTRVGDPSV